MSPTFRFRQRLPRTSCPVCFADVAVREIKGGDGSARRPVWHKHAETGEVPCPGIYTEVTMWRE